MLFGTLEYRIPVLPELRTTLLGVISLGKTTAAVVADGGMVWTDGNFSGAERRIGSGLEAKNVLRLGGLDILHAVGIAQPLEHLGSRSYDLYYRVRASIPF
jgi:hypothetical protein